MNLIDFDYELPEELIAQYPAADRGQSRLLVLDRATSTTSHGRFDEIAGHLRPGDVLVVNNSRVVAARLLGRRVPTAGQVECLLVGRVARDRWDALVHPGQKLRPGSEVVFEGAGHVLHGEILNWRFYGRRTIRLWVDDGAADVEGVIEAIGHVPLPPYIKRSDEAVDRERYQTVYARVRGSVAAPTAGLHFTDGLLAVLGARGVERTEVTLHIGYGTFKPIRSARVEDHVVDPEAYDITPEAAAIINRAIDERRRVIAVGTTTTRVLESAVRAGGGRLMSGRAKTDLFIYPEFSFRVVGALLTNFHLPRSSLLVLVCAFAGRERVLAAYREAVAERYRFYSYGDAMLIV